MSHKYIEQMAVKLFRFDIFLTCNRHNLTVSSKGSSNVFDMRSLDLPQLLMEDNSWPIMRLAGESVTRGSTCAAMRVGKSSSTESFNALWRKETQRVTDAALRTSSPGGPGER